MKKKGHNKTAQRAADRKRKRQEKRKTENRAIQEELDRENREIDRQEEEKLTRQLRGPCPRCDHTPLVVYMHGEDFEGEDVDRIELTKGAEVYPEWIRTCDRLIYCPNCGALHEIGGETHYPQAGIKGGPQPTDEHLETMAEVAARGPTLTPKLRGL